MEVGVQQQYPDASQRIMAVVKKATRGLFSPDSYFLGMPDNFAPAVSAFPLVIVDTVTEDYKVGPTTGDDVTEVVYIHVMADLKIGLGAPDTDNSVKRQLKTFISGRDPTTGYLLPTSLMYALRTNLTLSSGPVPGLVTINNDIHVTYAESHYKNLPETRDAVIEITVYERQMILNRMQPGT
jgi:hypothetical protein